MTKQQMEKRLKELNKIKNFTDENIREVAYLERQMERMQELNEA